MPASHFRGDPDLKFVEGDATMRGDPRSVDGEPDDDDFDLFGSSSEKPVSSSDGEDELDEFDLF